MPEAKLGRRIRSKEKGLLDKYDGLATAAGSETRPQYTHTHIHTHTHTHTFTHTHFQVQGLEKGVSENEAPGPIGAYTTTHNDTITLMPNLIHRISFTDSHSQNANSNVARGLPRVHRPAGAP